MRWGDASNGKKKVIAGTSATIKPRATRHFMTAPPEADASAFLFLPDGPPPALPRRHDAHVGGRVLEVHAILVVETNAHRAARARPRPHAPPIQGQRRCM